MENSDLLGLAGSFCLLVAPFRDQWLRYKSTRSRAAPGNMPESLKRLRLLVSEAYQNERHAYSGYDSAFMIVGASLLGLSYWVQT